VTDGNNKNRTVRRCLLKRQDHNPQKDASVRWQALYLKGFNEQQGGSIALLPTAL
jgi:hypothetical protein